MTPFKAFLAALSWCALCFEPTLAQEKKPKVVRTVFVNDSIAHYSQSDIFSFPNVNKVRYFHDLAKLKHMKELTNDSQEMYDALRDYVKNFGTENFAENVPMLW